MLKKKNIAMVMAAATVATSVAPVFAAYEKENVDETTLVEKVEELLNVKYSDSTESGKGVLVTAGNEYLNSVYEIRVDNPNGTAITSVSDLKQRIEDAKLYNDILSLYVIDKGHKEVNGKIVASEVNKYSKYYDSSDDTVLYDEVSGANLTTSVKAVKVEYFKENGDSTLTDNETAKAVITLANGTEVEVSTDDYKLNFAEPVDANGNIVSTTDLTTANAKKIVGFNLLENATEAKQDLPQKEISNLVFGENNVYIEENLSTYVTETGYTKEGVELVNTIKAARTAETEVVENGKTYEIAKVTVAEDISDVKPSEEGGYEFTINLIVNEKDSEVVKNVELVIKADSQKDLLALRTAVATASTDVVEGNGTSVTIAGDDRFETAVEVSKTAYPSDKADAVVLVGENAVVDGLAAAPLATQKNAPILLSKKDAVDSKTMAEIKRVIDKKDTVYIIGGENTISKEVEAQLIKEMDANIVRIAGDDRYDTSLEIAKKLEIGTTTATTKAFVVGGNGLADAMSIAAVASNALYTDNDSATPIIVTPANGLTTDAKHFLDKNTDITDVDVIGGTSNVSANVLADLKEIDKTVTRVAGNDRQETNAKVIDRYYGDSKIELDQEYDGSTAALINDIFVAQDGYVGGDSKLIDALAVAPLAGKLDAPIVLATNSLSLKQEQVIESKTEEHDVTGSTKYYNKLTKVGGGVSASVIQKVLKVLGLN